MKLIKTKKFSLYFSAAMIAAIFAGPAAAQDLTSVSEANDWTVFIDPNNDKHCYIVSAPKSSQATRSGEVVSVNRGDVRLYIGLKDGNTEPSFMAGYPLKTDGTPVEVVVGGSVFNYFTNPNVNAEFAWPLPQNDLKVINAMKAGSNVKVNGVSQRGTKTSDEFSLSGFTAAYNAANERCKS